MNTLLLKFLFETVVHAEIKCFRVQHGLEIALGFRKPTVCRELHGFLVGFTHLRRHRQRLEWQQFLQDRLIQRPPNAVTLMIWMHEQINEKLVRVIRPCRTVVICRADDVPI